MKRSSSQNRVSKFMPKKFFKIDPRSISFCPMFSASIEVVPKSCLITNCVQVHELDINRCSIKDTEFESEFDLVVESSGYLTSVAGYFDAFFDDPALENHVVLPTGPQAPIL